MYNRKRGAIRWRNAEVGELQRVVEELIAWGIQILQSRGRKLWVLSRRISGGASARICMGSGGGLLRAAAHRLQIPALGFFWRPLQRPCPHRRDGAVLRNRNSQSTISLSFYHIEESVITCFILLLVNSSHILLEKFNSHFLLAN